MSTTARTAQPHAEPVGAPTGQLSRWCVALGAAFVLLGGLVAAVTEPLALPKGSWLAAYLVLVCGVPQYVIGRLVVGVPPVRLGWLLVACWNVGNAGVIAGTSAGAPMLVDLGGILLLVPLTAVLRVTLRRQVPGLATGLRGPWRWPLTALLLVLIVSIPVGLVLAHLGTG